MTKSELVNAIRLGLDDLGITFYSTTDISDSISDGYALVTALAKTVESVTTLSYSTISPYYDFPSLVPDFFALVALYDNSYKRYLEYCPRPVLFAQTQRYELWNGHPTLFTVIDYRRTLILPSLTASAGAFKIFYRSFGPALSDGTILRIPKEAEQSVLYYAIADLLEQAQEFIKAQEQWALFYNSLSQGQSSMMNRSMPALITSFKGTKL
jgi:hypothetical protein